MATCSKCGQPVSVWQRDLFSGTCPKCQAVSTRPAAQPASLGCGTLVLIAIIVAVFSGRGTGDLEREVRDLRTEVGDLKKAIDGQSSELRQLRDRLPPPAKVGDGKGKE